MTYPTELSYSDDHEWVGVAPGTGVPADPVRVGVTSFAVESLGELVFIELPDVGASITAGDACGEIESTKSVSELVSPVTGAIVEVNAAVADDPSLVSGDPFGDGWLFAVRVSDLGALMTAGEYTALVAGKKADQ